MIPWAGCRIGQSAQRTQHRQRTLVRHHRADPVQHPLLTVAFVRLVAFTYRQSPTPGILVRHRQRAKGAPVRQARRVGTQPDRPAWLAQRQQLLAFMQQRCRQARGRTRQR